MGVRFSHPLLLGTLKSLVDQDFSAFLFIAEIGVLMCVRLYRKYVTVHGLKAGLKVLAKLKAWDFRNRC